jgi:hypothetical protein
LGVRELINRNNQLMMGVAIAGVALALVSIIILWRHREGPPVLGAGVQAFFSDDDGKTWFPDDATKIPPIDHNGKPAYRALVYRRGDSASFVSCLESFPPEVKTHIEQKAGSNLLDLQNAEFAAASQMLIKKPGAAHWLKDTPATDAGFMKLITSPDCPDGSKIMPTLVSPPEQ